MITIYTAEKEGDMQDAYYEHVHQANILWLPGEYNSPRDEARQIVAFLLEWKDTEVYIFTLREIAVNVLGHMIMRKMIDPSQVQVIILPDNQVAHYDSEGFLTDWPYGFYTPDMDELLGRLP